jgi:hypothetical protein
MLPFASGAIGFLPPVLEVTNLSKKHGKHKNVALWFDIFMFLKNIHSNLSLPNKVLRVDPAISTAFPESFREIYGAGASLFLMRFPKIFMLINLRFKTVLNVRNRAFKKFDLEFEIVPLRRRRARAKKRASSFFSLMTCQVADADF